jgi:hypothetical protein
MTKLTRSVERFLIERLGDCETNPTARRWSAGNWR